MQRELEEAERLRLEEARQQAKDKEKKVEEQHAVALAVEWRWATLEAPLSQAGPSRAPLRQPEQTLGGSKKVLGSLSQKKIAHGVLPGRAYAFGTWMGMHGVVSRADNSKNLASNLVDH